MNLNFDIHSNRPKSSKIRLQMFVELVVVVNFIKHQNRAITGERVAARAAPSYQYAMVLVLKIYLN